MWCQMDSGKLILILVVLALGYIAYQNYYVDDTDDSRDYSPDQFYDNPDYEYDDDQDNQTFSRGDDLNETNSTNTTEESEPLVPVCDWPNSGYPEYDGTNKEGDTCADVLTKGNGDLECIANPPSNYDGKTDIIEQTSDPPIECCMEDGKCYWM